MIYLKRGVDAFFYNSHTLKLFIQITDFLCASVTSSRMYENVISKE